MSHVIIAGLAGAATCLVGEIYLWFRMRELPKLRKELEQYKQVRNALYEKLADPESIEKDFERSAQASDMRRANRTTLPREGAGPPAKIHRPPLRGAKPGSGWRPNRVN